MYYWVSIESAEPAEFSVFIIQDNINKGAGHFPNPNYSLGRPFFDKLIIISQFRRFGEESIVNLRTA